MFKKYLATGFIDAKSYPQQFFGSKFSRLTSTINPINAVTNTRLLQRLFKPDPEGRMSTCGTGGTKYKWEDQDFLDAVND